MDIPEFPVMSVGDMLVDDSLVPAATHNVKVYKAVYVRVPKTEGANPYLALIFTITGPACSELWIGRYVYFNFPLVRGKFQYLSDLMLYTGHDVDFRLESPDQLVGLECGACVGIKPASGGYKAKNTILGFVPLV
jgi:hypothetical protein